ncbi:MAG: hypothetical protein INR70_22875 [Parafilimonas terrae]|nr:hypothetical protein [Parafilimonas terrae]
MSRTFSGRTALDRAVIDLSLYTSGITDPHAASVTMPMYGTERRLIGSWQPLVRLGAGSIWRDACQRSRAVNDR